MFHPLPRSPRDIVLVLLVTMLVAICGPLACQPVGPTYRQDSITTDGRPRAPNRIGLAQSNAERDFNYQVESTASASITEFQPDGAMKRASQGPPGREVHLRLPDGKVINVASGSDIEMSGVAYEQDGANRSVVRIDTFKTVTSEPQRAVNEAMDRLVPAWNKLSEVEKQAYVEAWENAAKLGDALAPELLTFFKLVAGG